MNTAFDLVLQHIPRELRDQTLEPGQTLYVFNPRKGQAAPYKGNLIRSLFGSEQDKYYLLNPTQRAICPPIKVEVTDNSHRPQVILVHVTVEGIEPPRVAEMINGLAKPGRRPFEVFAERIGKWLSEFIEQKQAANADPLAHFTKELRGECSSYVASQALNRLGLRLICALRLPEEDLNFGQVNIDLQDVLVHDDEEPLTARLELKLQPPTNDVDREYALQHVPPLPKLRDHIAAIALQWLRGKCSLEDYCYNVPDVRRRLEEELKIYLERQLRLRLFGFRLACNVPFDREFRVKEDFEVTCTVEPGRTTVPVQHKLLLERRDIARLRRANITNLEDWIGRLLDSKTKAALFDKKYVDVIVDFKVLSEAIKKEVESELDKIGFCAKQLITIPADEQMRNWIDGTLSFDTNSMECRTRDSNVKYRLSIQARVLFKSLDKVKNYLRPDKSLEDQFKSVAGEAAAEILRTFEPEHLYIRFSEQKADGNPSNGAVKSPEAQVRDAVTTRLFEKFDARTENITLTPERSELTDLYAAIRPARNHSFEIKVEARGRMGETLGYAIDYRVVSIEGWDRFQELCTNAQGADVPAKAREIFAAIDQMLCNPAVARMQGLPSEWLRSVRFKLTESIRNLGLDESAKLVAKHYGLGVEILSFRPMLSEWDRRQRLRTEGEYEKLVGELEQLREDKKAKEYELGPTDSTVMELANRITAKEGELDKFTPDHDEVFKTANLALEAQDWQKLLLNDKSEPKASGPADGSKEAT
jgi:hypothetical protein